jgi:hypothetical protein
LFWQISTLKQQEHPEIWVAADEGYLEQYTFVLSALPSKGNLFDPEDKQKIEVSKHNFQWLWLWLLLLGILFQLRRWGITQGKGYETPPQP